MTDDSNPTMVDGSVQGTVHPFAETARPTRLRLALFWVAMLASIVFVAFLGLEIGLRLLVNRALKAEKGSPLILSSVPGLGYQLAPNARGDIQTDGHGLRLRPQEQAPIRHGILLIGDSVAYGMGVAYEQSLVPLLEARLTQSLGENTAVWNAAVPGYNTTQEAIQLEQMAPVTKPDLVLVQFCMNDYQDAPVLTAEGWLDAMQAQDSASDFSILSLAYRSRAVVFFKEKLRDLQQVHPEWFPVGAHYIHYVQKKPGWARAKAALLRIGETASRFHARVLVVIFPVEQQLRIGDRAAQDDLNRFAEAHGIPVLDLYDGFRAHWRERLYIDYWKRTGVVDKLHLNPRGQALAAAEIAQAILNRRDFYLAVQPPASSQDSSEKAGAGTFAAR
jgi:lysophospholipase L1-like esterase